MFLGEDCNGDKILNRMPTTKNTSEAGSSKAQRYRPASEFDDATLAEKREYWRTKKREQRARLSEKRGRPKTANRGGKLLHSNKPVVTKSRASTSTAISSPPLLNNDGTVNSEEASRKERWFQRIKLNKVLPQFPTSSSGPCVAVSKSLVSCLSTGGAPSGSVTSSKPNGALLHSGSSVPPPKAMVQHSVLAPRQTQDAVIMTNGSSTTVSPRCVVVQGPSGPRALPKSQVTLRIQPKLMTENVAAGVKFVAHSAPVVVHQVIGGCKGNKSALVMYQNARGRPSNHTPAKSETEEERAARRRELWRVKKREQRAKQAARLAKTREQMKHMEGASQRKSAGLAHERRPTAAVRDGQRLVVNRAKAPFTAAGRLLRNAKVATPSSSMPKLITIPIKKETDFSQSSDIKPSPCNLNQQSIEIKVEDPQSCKGTMLRPIPSIPVGNKTVDHSRRPHGPPMFPTISRGMVRCRTPRQRLIEAQKSFLSQRSKSPFHSMVFTTRNPPRDNPSETPEQRAAQRREYWRVKKREQRANQSLEVKARMKERDALKRRVKRYQSILLEMRRARAAGFGTVATPTGNTLTNASETIGGFIKEDGTVTISLPQINSDLTNRSKETGACGYSLSTTGVHATPRHPFKNTVLGSNANRNFVLGHEVPNNPPPPPLRLAHVKVTCPPVGQSVNRPPRLFSIRPRIESQSTTKPATNSPTLVIRAPSQITLTHPQNLQTPLPGMSTMGPNSAGCVMKMAITSSAQPLAPPHLGPELTEEERMVRKREYWRVKKREQRAARAARLKQGASQAKGNAAAKRGWIQKPPPRLAVSRVTCVKRAANITARTPPLPIHGVSTQTHEVKQEREPSPAADLHKPAEEPICPDIKPALPPPPPGPQPEPDPGLSADSQATTLLAVASMKKLLEESLSTVTECAAAHDNGEAAEQHSCKAERQACSSEEASEQEEKPNLPLLSFGDEEEEEEEEEKVPIDDDLTLDVKTWRVDVDALAHLKRSSFSSEGSALLPSCSENLSDPLLDAPSHTCTPSAPSGVPTPPLPRRAQRLRDKKAGYHHCCSPEPPKLHHLPLPTQQPQQQQCKQQHQLQIKQQQPSPQQQQCKPQSQRPQQQQPHDAPVASELNNMSSLQKKREYWRFMKRQQRARSKARQKDGVRPGDYSRRLALKAAQSPNLFITKSLKPVQRGGGFGRGQLPAALQPKPFVLPQPVAAPVSVAQASLTTVTSIPTVLVVSPTASNIGQPPATLKVKPPIGGVSHSPQQVGVPLQSLQTSPRFSTVSLPVTVPSLGNGKEGRLLLVENQQEAAQGSRLDSPRVRKWSLQVQEAVDSDIAPIPTLTPPVNPLTSIKLLPIQPLSQPLTHTPTQIPTKISPRPQNKPSQTISPVVPVSNMVPPKPIQGESDEEFLRRKREYWRVKKKEQRARKAMKDRQLTQKRASVNWKPILPNQNQLQGLDEQDSGQWGANISEDNEHLNSSSNTDLGYYPYLSHTEPIEDESDLYFPEYKDTNNEDGPISEAVWRSRYLMDQDPLNQLLVCMVCGELQYSHTLEAVQAHIEEAHPDTLNLAAPEHSRILEAWDEQVSQRERFFTSQLQQHS